MSTVWQKMERVNLPSQRKWYHEPWHRGLGVMEGGGESGCWLENVQMAGRNGGVLIACLQISHRLLSVTQSMFHYYGVWGNRSEAGHLLLYVWGARQLIMRGPFERRRGHTVSTHVVCVDSGVGLCMLSTDYLCFSLCLWWVMFWNGRETVEQPPSSGLDTPLREKIPLTFRSVPVNN